LLVEELADRPDEELRRILGLRDVRPAVSRVVQCQDFERPGKLGNGFLKDVELRAQRVIIPPSMIMNIPTPRGMTSP
jgi:hypothetical protein